MCKRPKLFGNKCKCQQGCCGCGQQACGQGGCSAPMMYGDEASGNVSAPEQLMPPPPQPTTEQQQPYDNTPSPGDQTRSHVRKNWNMPRLTSTRSKASR
jgi:hypothetical protein